MFYQPKCEGAPWDNGDKLLSGPLEKPPGTLNASTFWATRNKESYSDWTFGRELAGYLKARGIPAGAVDRLAGMCEADGLKYPRSIEGRYVWNTHRAQEMALWAAERLDAEAMLELHERRPSR